MAIRPQLLFDLLIMAVVVAFVFRRKRAPLASFVAGLLAVVVLVLTHNSMAANQPAGLATNGALNFWFGHCEFAKVTTLERNDQQTAWFVPSVPYSLERGDDYVFTNIDVWDEKVLLLARLAMHFTGQAGTRRQTGQEHPRHDRYHDAISAVRRRRMGAKHRADEQRGIRGIVAFG